MTKDYTSILITRGKLYGEGGGGGRLPNEALFGEASPRGPIPYRYKYNFLDKRYHFRVTSIEKLYPFHISA